MPNWKKVITSGSDAVLATTTTNELTITGVVNAGVDTDKFLVLDSSNNVDFRTGAQVLSDIGGGGGSSVWTTDTNGITYTAGNVGIGGASDSSADLKVYGDTILGSSNQIGNVSITNQQNLSTSTGTTTIASVLIASYDAVFIDFVIKKGTNIRSGTVYACHDGTNVEFTETSTNDLGDTADVELVVNISGTDLRLQAVIAASTWEIKTFIRAL
tara:strand:- start:37 stop:678 length:642 start_codon:yes stop_codon:yes gene_type:complete